ncbi:MULTISPECIES: hypothetical protein [Glutamicibacter]|uniref:hypothetical protein n=1 Tax=Glutamicibacter TaxID=1742989 RepID=UPI0010FD4152|nr:MULTISPECIES: hypothetical protein [Glutamicibacter]TLK56416.1 hypothetical protein FDN03_02970 [Glutamicibacter sp. V16R2B1]
MSIEPWISIVSALSGLGGAIIGGAIALHTNRQNHIREQNVWLRQEKIVIYTDLLNFYRVREPQQYLTPEEQSAIAFDLNVHLTRVKILCPPEIVRLAEETLHSFTDYVSSFTHDLLPVQGARADFSRAFQRLESAILNDLQPAIRHS